MKKFVTTFIAIVMCMLCIPLLSACSGKGSSELKYVQFTQEVFEVDKDQTFVLSYNVYPSTAENYSLTFDFLNNENPSESLSQVFTYQEIDGKLHCKIIEESCPEIKGYVYYGAGENDCDTCIIKLKKYPTQIYFDVTEDIINSGASYSLQLKAKINGVEQTIDNSKYNIELVSSAENVISVSNNSMMAVSTGLPGSATITARIIKLNGSYLGMGIDYPKGYTATIILNVVQNVGSWKIKLSSQDEFIKTSTDYNPLDCTYTTTENSLDLNIWLYSLNNSLIDNNTVSVTVTSSNNNVATVNKNGDYWVVLFNNDGTVCIEIISNAVDQNGNPVKIVFYLTKTTPVVGP